MRNLSKHIFFIGFIVIHYGCRSPLELELPDSKALVAIEGFINPTDKFYVYVNPINPIGKLNPIENLEDTKVNIFVGQKLYNLEKVATNGEDGIVFSHPEATWPENENYTLTIQVEGQEPISAHTSIPKKNVNINEFNISDVQRNSGTFQSVKVNLDWIASDSKFGYYHVLFYKVNYIIGIDGVPVPDPSKDREYLTIDEAYSPQTKELITLSHEPGVLIDARKVDGLSSINLTGYCKTQNVIYNNKESFKEIQVELRAVTEEYYKYQRSLFIQMKGSRGGINEADPSIGYTNMKNATGIFGGYVKIYDFKSF